MSPENLAHVAISDQELGSLLKTLSLFGLFGQYHIRVTSDLGGVVMNEAVTREETEVPWVAFGPGVKRGMTISRQLSVIDTAPTIARLMNLPSLSAWEGMAIEEILAGEGEGISLEKVA